MAPKAYSSATPLEAANALAQALLILRREEAERMGFKIKESIKVVRIDDQEEVTPCESFCGARPVQRCSGQATPG